MLQSFFILSHYAYQKHIYSICLSHTISVPKVFNFITIQICNKFLENLICPKSRLYTYVFSKFLVFHYEVYCCCFFNEFSRTLFLFCISLFYLIVAAYLCSSVQAWIPWKCAFPFKWSEQLCCIGDYPDHLSPLTFCIIKGDIVARGL